MKRVFISYCREDGDFADNLRNKLDDEGIPTWQDVDLHGGQNWRAEIDLAIRDALAVIVVISPDACRSEWVAYEWAFALGVGVNVVPVLLKIEAGGLHPALKSRQCLEFSNRNARPWDLLFRAIRGAASPDRPTTVRVPPDAPPVLEQAARALDSLEEGERKAAIATFEQMKHPAVVEVLASAVCHPIQDVRIQAGLMLSTYGDARALPALLEGVRAHQARGYHLARLGKAVVPALIEALRGDDSGVRQAAVDALGEIGDPAAIPALKQALGGDLDREIIGALGHFADPALLSDFERAFQNSRIAEIALRAAAKLPDGAGFGLFQKALRHQDADIRRVACILLEEMRRGDTLPLLAVALKDPSEQVRFAAARALAELGDPAAPLLFEALEDEYGGVCDRALEGLTRIGPAVTSGLIAFLRDPDRIHRAYAARGLGELGDESATPALIEALQQPELCVSAINALGELGRPGGPAAPALAPLVSSLERPISEAAVRALRKIADPASVETLSGALRNPIHVQLATDALRRIGTPEAQRALKDWLREKQRL